MTVLPLLTVLCRTTGSIDEYTRRFVCWSQSRYWSRPHDTQLCLCDVGLCFFLALFQLEGRSHTWNYMVLLVNGE
jgi:hypothetical protein